MEFFSYCSVWYINCVFYCCFLGSQLCTQSITVCWVFAGSWQTMVSSTLGGSAVPCRLNIMPEPSGKAKNSDPWKRKVVQAYELHVMRPCEAVSCYQVFGSICSHCRWLVGEINCFAFQRLEVQVGGDAPLPPLEDRLDPALLVRGVGHLQHLSVGSTHWARKLHNLETRGFTDVRRWREHSEGTVVWQQIQTQQRTVMNEWMNESVS